MGPAEDRRCQAYGDSGGTLYVVGDKSGPLTADGNSTGAVGVALIGDGGRGPVRIDHTQANNANKSLSAPVVLSDGSVVTLFHEYLATSDASSRGWIGGLWSIASTDGGRSFGTRNFVAKDLRPGMVALAADTSRNPDMLYAVWPSTAGAIHVATSDSRGDRWSAPVPIGPLDDGDITALAAATDGQGAVAILWSAAANAPEGSVCRDIWFAPTRDGKTFSSPTRMQEGASCVVVEGVPRSGSMTPSTGPTSDSAVGESTSVSWGCRTAGSTRSGSTQRLASCS